MGLRINLFIITLPLLVDVFGQLRLGKGGPSVDAPQRIVGFLCGGRMLMNKGDLLLLFFAFYFS